MKMLDFNSLSHTVYSIRDISVIRQTNQWSVCSHPEGRGFNGFLLLVDGECKYTCGSDVINLRSGGLIYLPKGAKHSVVAPERTLDFYRINFNMIDVSDEEEIVFSKSPLIISDSTPGMLFDICEQLRKATLASDSEFKCLSLLYELLDYSKKVSGKSIGGRIGKAIEYLNEHYTEDTPVSELAKTCFISEAHLYRLFKKEIGSSPIDYKNALRLKKAEELLHDPECSIGEIASMLGFENACYFTRIFKAKHGMSPLKYRSKTSDNNFVFITK